MSRKAGSADPLIPDEEVGLRSADDHKVEFNGDVEAFPDDAKRGDEQELEVDTKATAEVRDHVQAVIDETEGLQKPTIVRNLMIAYVVSVVLVILLSIAGQLAVHIVIHNSFSDSLVVNIAGRQRMLSQLISKDCVSIAYYRGQEKNVTFYVNQLKLWLPVFRSSHYGLWKGNSSLGLSKTSKGSIVKNFQTLDPIFLTIYNTASSALTLDLINLDPNSTDYKSVNLVFL